MGFNKAKLGRKAMPPHAREIPNAKAKAKGIQRTEGETQVDLLQWGPPAKIRLGRSSLSLSHKNTHGEGGCRPGWSSGFSLRDDVWGDLGVGRDLPSTSRAGTRLKQERLDSTCPDLSSLAALHPMESTLSPCHPVTLPARRLPAYPRSARRVAKVELFNPQHHHPNPKPVPD